MSLAVVDSKVVLDGSFASAGVCIRLCSYFARCAKVKGAPAAVVALRDLDTIGRADARLVRQGLAVLLKGKLPGAPAMSKGMESTVREFAALAKHAVDWIAFHCGVFELWEPGEPGYDDAAPYEQADKVDAEIREELGGKDDVICTTDDFKPSPGYDPADYADVPKSIPPTCLRMGGKASTKNKIKTTRHRGKRQPGADAHGGRRGR